MNEPGIPAPLYISTAAPLPPGALTFGQILDRIFHLMRSNFRLFVGIASAPAAGMAVFNALMMAAMLLIVKPWHPQIPPPIFPMMGWFFAAVFLFDLLILVIFALYEAAASYAALQANAGITVTIGQSWAAAWRKAGRYIWLAILRALIVALPIMIVAGLIAGSAVYAVMRSKSGCVPQTFFTVFPLLMLLDLGAVVYAILIMLRILLAVPACVAENLTAWRSICRSNQLTQGARGRIFLLGLVLYAIVYVAVMVLELAIFSIVAVAVLVGAVVHLTMVPWGWTGIGILAVVFVCALWLWSACIWAVYSAAIVVVYHDQRLRKESSTPAPAA
jgi:hypothetical protein